jgi:hypothetical protein
VGVTQGYCYEAEVPRKIKASEKIKHIVSQRELKNATILNTMKDRQKQ